MTEVKETSRGSVILISLVSTFCSVFTVAVLTTGLDVPAIMLSCILAVWAGTRQPRASLKQIYWGWGIGGVVSFVSSLFSPLIGFFFQSEAAEIALIAFWTLLAMPVIGIICAIRGRQWRDERDTKMGLGLLLFIILASFSPIAAMMLLFNLQSVFPSLAQ